jgi:hypothetical protein
MGGPAFTWRQLMPPTQYRLIKERMADCSIMPGARTGCNDSRFLVFAGVSLRIHSAFSAVSGIAGSILW